MLYAVFSPTSMINLRTDKSLDWNSNIYLSDEMSYNYINESLNLELALSSPAAAYAVVTTPLIAPDLVQITFFLTSIS